MADTDAAKAEKIAAAKKRVSGVIVVHNPDYPNLPSENSLPDTYEHSFPLPVPLSGLGIESWVGRCIANETNVSGTEGVVLRGF